MSVLQPYHHCHLHLYYLYTTSIVNSYDIRLLYTLTTHVCNPHVYSLTPPRSTCSEEEGEESCLNSPPPHAHTTSAKILLPNIGPFGSCNDFVDIDTSHNQNSVLIDIAILNIRQYIYTYTPVYFDGMMVTYICDTAEC